MAAPPPYGQQPPVDAAGQGQPQQAYPPQMQPAPVHVEPAQPYPAQPAPAQVAQPYPPAQVSQPYPQAAPAQVVQPYPQAAPVVVAAAPAPQVVVTQQTTVVHGREYYQTMIPIMPMGLAVLCCVLNVVGPGFGTLIAAFSVFCCASFQQQGQEACGVFTVNFFIALGQFATAWIFLLGWFWSIFWGCMFISLSSEYYAAPPVVATTTVQTIH